MQPSTRRDPRSYRTPGVVNDNLARDLTRRELEERLERSGRLDFDQQYRRVQETNADKLSRQRRARKASVRQAQSIPIFAVFGGMVMAVLAVMIVNCQVQINAMSSGIVDMKRQIQELEIEQVSLQTRYEQAFDLAVVKEAAEAAGMHQPGDGQIIYINLPGEDQAVTGMDQVEGGLGNFFASLGQHIYTVLEYFR